MSLLAAYLGPSMIVGDLPLAAAQAATVPPFGLGWYPGPEAEPIRTASSSFADVGGVELELTRHFATECAMVSHGAGSTGEGQPFRWGPLLFGIRSRLDHYEDVFEPVLFSRLSPEARRATRSRSPEAVLFMAWLDALQGRTDSDALADGLERMVGMVQDLALTHEATATFSIIATNGDSLVTLRTGTVDELPPVYTMVVPDEGLLPARARLVTTEQVLPGAWTSLEPHSMVIFTRDDE
jgi:hypothetical protein